MEKQDQEALKDFLLDINCLDELQKWENHFNLFDVLKICRTEIRHSNVLSWLLNPNENHNLGDAVIKKVFQEFIKNQPNANKEVMQLLLMDFYSFSVYREWKNIDILLVSDDEKIVIAIENKVGSHEHDNQLKRYKDILNKEFPKYKKILIYLTPDGEEPSDDEWSVLTYESIVENLEIIRKNATLSTDVALMIDNYIEVIRRDIMEDKELIEICNKIYNKHKKALDLIFEYRIDPSQASSIVRDILQEMADEGKIIYDNAKTSTYVRFYTKAMNQLLPNLVEHKGAWGNEHCYAYEFRMMNGKFRLSCVLTTKNLLDTTRETVRKIVHIEKPAKEKLDFQWLSLHSKTYNIPDDCDDNEKIISTVKSAINSLLSWEKDIISKVG